MQSARLSRPERSAGGAPNHPLGYQPRHFSRRSPRVGRRPKAGALLSWILGGKDADLRNLPFHDFVGNQAWLELVLAAQDLITFFQRLCLSGEAQCWEPKRLRYRLLPAGHSPMFHSAIKLRRGSASSSEKARFGLDRSPPQSRLVPARQCGAGWAARC